MLEIDLKQIATILESTMANAGILDDYDELLGDIHDSDPVECKVYHDQVVEAFKLINYFKPEEEQYNVEEWEEIWKREVRRNQ